MTNVINLTSGERDSTNDAGYWQPASLGDYVWLDANADGVQDASEQGIPGVTVYLLDQNGNRIDSTTTDGNGGYTFDDLLPGTYSVAFVPPAGLGVSPQDATGDAADSDIDDQSFTTPPTTLNAGDKDPTLDAGFFPLAGLGDYVWEDQNANGIQDPGDQGINGVSVYLLDAAGNVLDSTTTANNGMIDGYYIFDSLPPGDYVVRFGEVPGYVRTVQLNATGDDPTDSDADPATGETGLINLSANEFDPTNDAGYYQAASLGDYVWDDLDGDGTQDPGEPGIPNVTVYLLDDQRTQIDSTTTDPTGLYGFDDLVPGTYAVQFVTPPGYDPTDPNSGNDDTDDSDPIGGITPPTMLQSGDNDPTLDAGFVAPAGLGDFVWKDTNGDGLQDPGEPGINGVTVYLLDAVGNVLDSTTTANNGSVDGYYAFNDLDPGDYIVQFTSPAGYVPTQQLNTAGDDPMDSDADPMTLQTGIINLQSGEFDPTNDAGFYEPASLGDYVWLDTNADGVQDPSEQPVPGVTVYLLDAAGAVLDSTTTDQNGLYGFDQLPPGDYVVQVIPPAGTSFSPQDQGADDTVDSDVDPNTGRTGTITLSSGENDPTNDAGLIPLASLGDYVWSDFNRDGVQDAGEPPIAGVQVYLLDQNGMRIDSTTTDAAGFYQFTDLTPGIPYAVEFITPMGYFPTGQDQGADDTKDSDADPMTGQTQQVTLPPGENNPTLDAGFFDRYDLAITKTLAQGQAGVVDPGDLVTFTLRVYNQGTRDAQSIEIVDYLPPMTSLADPASTDNGNGTASYTLAGPIAPNGSASIDITLMVSPFFNTTGFTNVAEIAGGEDQDGNPRQDDDGSFDSDPSNDGTPIDDEIFNGGGDEDNSDPAPVTVNQGCVGACDMTDWGQGQYSFLFTVGNFPGTSPRYSYVGGSGRIERFLNNSAHLTGTLVNESDPSLRWEVDVWLINGRDWGSWSSLGRSYKIGTGVPPMLFQSWDYYELDASRSRLVGQGGLAGDTLKLTHMPSTFQYGFQYGQGANAQDADFGLSGWFDYSSTSGSYSGSGDFIADLNNCASTCNTPPQ